MIGEKHIENTKKEQFTGEKVLEKETINFKNG